MNDAIKYRRILAAVRGVPWAIEEQRLVDVMEVLSYVSAGGTMTPEEIRAYVDVEAARKPRASTAGDGAVAVIGIRGILAPRAEQVNNVSGPGGTSMEGLRARFRAALDSADISSIVFDVDSPGGNVVGIQEMADEIHAARGRKPIIAVASHGSSAAYWLASQADEFVVTPSGSVGSIGVMAAHSDVSEKLAAEGERVTLVHAGAHKVEGSPFAPLTEEALAHMQSRVDAFYRRFVDAVARGRGVTASTVEEKFGQGRAYESDQALERGMVDGIETLESVIGRLRASTPRPARAARVPRSAAEFAFWPHPGR